MNVRLIFFYFFFGGGGVDKRYILTSLGKVLWISSLIFIYLLIIGQLNPIILI